MSTAEPRAGSSGTGAAEERAPASASGEPGRGASGSPPVATARARPVRDREAARPSVSASTARNPVVRPPRRRGATVRKVDPWSVLKLSVIFYLCVLLVAMLALTVFWAVVNRAGVLDALYTIAADTFNVQIRFDGGNIARALFLIGLLNVVLGSALNVFLAFLYNLIADLVGGLRVILELEE